MGRSKIILMIAMLACTSCKGTSQQGASQGEDAMESGALASVIQQCEDGDAGSCGSAAAIYDHGDGYSHDSAKAATYYTKAITLFNKSCDAGSAIDCNRLAQLYKRGEGVAQNDAAANALYARSAVIFGKACDAGNPDACATLADMYDEGEGLVPDKAKSAALYAKACARDREWCQEQKGSSVSLSNGG